MKPRYLLDTNALSEPLRVTPDEGFLQAFAEHDGRLAISVVTWFEALRGLLRMPEGQRAHEVQRFLFEVIAPNLPILSYDTACAERHAQETARIEAAGRRVDLADAQIAATAMVHGLILVTRNDRDFRPFGRELRIESWWG